MQGEGDDDGSQQPQVDPRRHPEQGLVLRQTGGEEVGIDQNICTISDFHESRLVMLQRSNEKDSGKLTRCQTHYDGEDVSLVTTCLPPYMGDTNQVSMCKLTRITLSGENTGRVFCSYHCSF